MTEPGQPCSVCGRPDPEHDWDVHEAQEADYQPAPEGARQAANMLARSSSRGGATVRWLAVHSTEGIMRAHDLRDWAAWPGSSHASADASGVLLTPADGFVPYERAAWTLRNGNPVSENIELCALARWSRGEWLARPALLEACARWLAGRSKARGIPLRKLTVAQVRTGQAGVIDHDDYTDATGDGGHWDVGEQFPWDVVMARAIALATPPQPVQPSGADRPSVFRWGLPAGHYYGNINGPAQSHGGATAAERLKVQNIQRWLIFRGCVRSVPAKNWRTSGWADGRWEAATDRAMVEWHRRFYPGQAEPAQCWADDYRRLTD